MYLPDYVIDIIYTLENAGFEAYAVGGCIRDTIMHKIPSDWDITTSAAPDDTARIFSHLHTIPTGIKHGTVTVVSNGIPIEITTFRIDGEYSDSRHPSSVKFTGNLNEDLCRRDFTVNAMAYNPKRGLVDIFGGKDDINKKIIRCVGRPEKRFCEDALRIMRALRFAVVLDFEIEPATAGAAFGCRTLLCDISAERIASELNKMITAPDPSYVLTHYRDILAEIMPEIIPSFDFNQNNPHHCFDVWNHTVEAIRNSVPDLCVRLALLFHDLAKPSCAKADENGYLHFKGHPALSASIADRILRRLKYDNVTRKTVRYLVETHDVTIAPDKVSLKKFLKTAGSNMFSRLLEVRLADNLAKSPQFTERYNENLKLKELYENIISNNECFSLKTLAVNGSDLIANGEKPGKEIGQKLDFLLDCVIEGKCENKRDALIKLSEQYPC